MFAKRFAKKNFIQPFVKDLMSINVFFLKKKKDF